MRIRALALRILNQLRRDKRTMALMIMAPMLMLTLVYFILEASSAPLTVAVINAPESYVARLEDQNFRVFRFSKSEARGALEKGQAVASVDIKSGKAYIEIDGTDQTKASKTLSALEAAKINTANTRPDLTSDITYLYGSSDFTLFDSFGSVLIGFIIFFFVFLVAGISFLQERTTGTLERLLSTPIRRFEVIAGYVLGFAVFTVVQAMLISWFSIYILNIMMVGSLALVMLISLLSAIAALALGMLMSTAANNEFQMIQFIPVIIVPQIFFSGLFDLNSWMQVVGWLMPLYYTADALEKVMLKGNGFLAIAPDLAVIAGFALVFMTINSFLLKKYRRI